MSSERQRCCIPQCVNHHAAPDDANSGAFFPVPSVGNDDGIASDSGLRRALWLRRIRKCTLDFDPDTALLCSRHFVEGKPAALEETSRLDWLPNAELDGTDELCEDVEDFVLEEDDEDDDEEEEDEEFINFNKRQKEKLEVLKRENVALKRKIQELGQGGIIQGMRLKMLKSMKVDSDGKEIEEEDEEEAAVEEEQVAPMEEVLIKIEPEGQKQDPPPPQQPKLQINSLKMKLNNILGTIK